MNEYKEYSESMLCPQCGEIVRWSSRDDNHKFGGVISKLKEHLSKDVKCCRERKLSNLLGEKENLLVNHFLENFLG